MPDQQVIVITGAGRGLGNALARAYLARPNHTVIGSIRDDAAPGVAELKASPKGDGSRLIFVKIDGSSTTDAANAVKAIEAEGIQHIDVLIANAGVSPPLEPIETVDIGTLSSAFQVNTIAPLTLYQACHELLKKSSNANGKTYVAPSYCISKAALNWITLAAHCSNPWLTSIAINPGLVATDMGNKTAKYLGLEKAPWTPEQSAEKVINIIDNSSREKYSGKFVDAITGNEFPW
ncbi:NAD(P)-binding protein [Xylaria grammica]|nr:NAD(P)-binding protein [Xylaria grammica]